MSVGDSMVSEDRVGEKRCNLQTVGGRSNIFTPDTIHAISLHIENIITIETSAVVNREV